MISDGLGQAGVHTAPKDKPALWQSPEPLKTDDSAVGSTEQEDDGLPSFDYVLHTVNLTTHPRARCLDGSAGSYYLRKASRSSKFFLFHEGGGWCSPDVPFRGGVGVDHCYNRSLGSAGSSRFNSPVKPLPLSGSSGAYFSYNRSTNPVLYDFNSVLINYCDGAAFSGRRAEPWTVLGRSLFFQGSYILDAVAADLKLHHGLAQATEVVVGGCSAGGHAAILQVDPWRARLPPTAFVVGLPDSGFFLDWASPPRGSEPQSRSFHTDLGGIFHAANASVNQACTDAHVVAGADPARCFFAEHTMPFVRTPVFLLQSVFDAWQTGNILGSSNGSAVNPYGAEVAARLVELAFPPGSSHSGFIDSCWHHCSDNQWFVESIDGITMRDAFTRWYKARKAEWRLKMVSSPKNRAPPEVHWQDRPFPCEECCVSQKSDDDHVVASRISGAR